MATDKPIERLTMSVEEAGEAIGISRSTAYSLCKQGKLGAIRVSERRWVVPKQAVERLLGLWDSQRN